MRKKGALAAASRVPEEAVAAEQGEQQLQKLRVERWADVEDWEDEGPSEEASGGEREEQ